MERTRTVERNVQKTIPDGSIRWQNTGGGVLFLKDGRKIKSGDVFFASPNQISLAFRDTIKPLDKMVNMDDVIEKTAVKTTYNLVRRGAGNWYDIVDSNNKIVSEKALQKEKALEYIKNLEG